VRLDANLCGGDGFFDVAFELQGPETVSQTVSLSAAEIISIKGDAEATGVPYHGVSWALPAGLTPGSYTLTVSTEDETGAMNEIARRPALVITP
jgi:hypothetical protein